MHKTALVYITFDPITVLFCIIEFPIKELTRRPNSKRNQVAFE
jgi:hypothetical protein